MFKKRSKSNKEQKPRPAAMYVSKSKKGERFYKLAVSVELLEGVEPDQNRRIHLVGFKNDYKENERHPDVFFYFSEKREDGGNKGFKPKPKPKYEAHEDDEAEESSEEADADGEDDEDEDSIPF